MGILLPVKEALPYTNIKVNIYEFQAAWDINFQVLYTTLSRERAAQSDKLIKEHGTKVELIESAKRFVQVLEEMDENEDNEISAQELRNAVRKVLVVNMYLYTRSANFQY